MSECILPSLSVITTEQASELFGFQEYSRGTLNNSFTIRIDKGVGPYYQRPILYGPASFSTYSAGYLDGFVFIENFSVTIASIRTPIPANRTLSIGFRVWDDRDSGAVNAFSIARTLLTFDPDDNVGSSKEVRNVAIIQPNVHVKSVTRWFPEIYILGELYCTSTQAVDITINTTGSYIEYVTQ